MTFLYVILAIVFLFCWIFSMFAAFLFGQTFMVKAQAEAKERLLFQAKDIINSILERSKNDKK